MKRIFPITAAILFAVSLALSLMPSQPSHGYGHMLFLLPLLLWFRNKAHRRWLLLFGVAIGLWLLAFPEPDLGFLGWVLIWPYLSARACDDGATWWKAAFLFGFLRAYAGFSWLGSIHFGAWLGVCLLSAFVFVVCFEWPMRWGRRVPFALRAATGWLLFEWAHAWLLGGFPWLYIAHTQYTYLPVIQMADLFGVPGVSFVMAYAGAAVWARKRGEILVATALVAGMLGYGLVRTGPANEPSGASVLMIQSAVPFSMKESGDAEVLIEQQLMQLTAAGLKEFPETDLIVWPETLHPIPYVETLGPRESLFLHSVLRNARRFQRPVIYGLNSYTDMNRVRGRRGHNSAILIDRAGSPRGLYRKQVLVPMGEEFLPRRLFSEETCDGWKRWLVHNAGLPASSDLESGEEYVTLNAGPGLRCAMLICFEGLYPEMAREAIHTGDPDLILHLVNNGWFAESREERQSVASWVFRAVETRTPFLSCANGGITCSIAPSGEIIGSVNRVMEPGFLHAKVPARWSEPMYQKGGHLALPVGLAVLWALFFLMPAINKKKPIPNPS